MFLLIKWLKRILLYSLILMLTSSQYLLSSSVVAADESEKSIEKDVNSQLSPQEIQKKYKKYDELITDLKEKCS